MRKSIFYIFIIFFIIISFLVALFIRKKIDDYKIAEVNREYLYYKGKTIKINNVVTIMNKAIESNKNNNLKLNDKNEFEENDTNSIKIYLEIKSRGSLIPMEVLLLSDKGGTEKIENLFSDMFFEYGIVEYHEKTGKIKKIIFVAIEDELEET